MEKINILKFRLELPEYLKWKPEISLEHLEPCPVTLRQLEPQGPLEITDVREFIIGGIID